MSLKLTACALSLCFLECLKILLTGGADLTGGRGGKQSSICDPFLVFLWLNDESLTKIGSGRGLLKVSSMFSVFGGWFGQAMPSKWAVLCWHVYKDGRLVQSFGITKFGAKTYLLIYRQGRGELTKYAKFISNFRFNKT